MFPSSRSGSRCSPALGAAPVSIPLNEAYSALQTKVADGQENPLALIDVAKFYEVQKYCSLTNHAWDGFWLLASGRVWQNVPPDVQQVMAKHFNEARRSSGTISCRRTLDLQKSLEVKGLAFNAHRSPPPSSRRCRRAASTSKLEGQVRRRGVGSSPEICRQYRVIAMHASLDNIVDRRRARDRHRAGAALQRADRDARLDGRARGGGPDRRAEIVVLFAGILARYVFHQPIVWSDELASILFLWLAMLGSVIAFQRGEHMRMTAIVGMLTPRARAFLDVVAIAAALAFLLLVIHPAYEFAADEIFVTTPALEIANAWRAAALPVGIALMMPVALLRLAQVGDWRHVAGAVALVAALIGALVLLAPVLQPLGNLNLLIFFVGLVGAMVFAAVPIAFSFGLATFGYIALTTSTPELVVIGRMDEGMSHLILLSVPLFVFLGLLIEMTGMARAMVGFLASLLGHVRGGLHYVLVGAMYLVSGISGSKAADMAAVAPVLFPEMKAARRQAGRPRRAPLGDGRADRNHPAEPRAHHHRLGHGRVDRRPVHGRASARHRAGDHALRRGVVALPRRGPVSHVKRATWREIGWAFLIAIPAIALPFVIRAAVIEGVATATEVSTIGIVYSILAGLLIYRQFPGGASTPCWSKRRRSRARSC